MIWVLFYYAYFGGNWKGKVGVFGVWAGKLLKERGEWRKIIDSNEGPKRG